MDRVEYICVLGACQEAYVVNVWIGVVIAIATLLAVIAWYELGSGRKDEAVRETVRAIEFEASSVLNRYEYVGISFRQGGGDLQTYLSWFRASVIREWYYLRPIVLYLRGNHRLFEVFEWLVQQAESGNFNRRPS